MNLKKLYQLNRLILLKRLVYVKIKLYLCINIIMEKKHRIICLGDTHGRNIWKEIVAKEESDDTMIIFIGDYFDSHTKGYSANRQIQNFKDILAYKKARPDNVILLVGNHDFHYIKGIGETYSGYQASYAIDIGEVIHEALAADLLQMCYAYDNGITKYVFTHAGVTKTWVAANDIVIEPSLDKLAAAINDLFKYKPNKFKFTVGSNYDNYGDDITQTPIWVRPESLNDDMLDGIVCVVGHTYQDELFIGEKVILIDTLGSSLEYLVIKDGVAKSVKFRYHSEIN